MSKYRYGKSGFEILAISQSWERCGICATVTVKGNWVNSFAALPLERGPFGGEFPRFRRDLTGAVRRTEKRPHASLGHVEEDAENRTGSAIPWSAVKASAAATERGRGRLAARPVQGVENFFPRSLFLSRKPSQNFSDSAHFGRRPDNFASNGNKHRRK